MMRVIMQEFSTSKTQNLMPGSTQLFRVNMLIILCSHVGVRRVDGGIVEGRAEMTRPCVEKTDNLSHGLMMTLTIPQDHISQGR
jgi:hypothetical protein